MSMPIESVLEFSGQQSGCLHVAVATTAKEVAASQRLRYEIFCEEMGANLRRSEDGLDADDFDEHCIHLLVTDVSSSRLVGSTRLLLNSGAQRMGMFYSESEFMLDTILSLPGRFMEVGRTCIHRDYRTGAAIRTLWNGIAQQIIAQDIDYLIGCASLPMDCEGAIARAIIDRLRGRFFTPESLRAQPRLPLPESASLPECSDVLLPPLLKAYIRLGAQIGGDACWDPEFNVADVFVLLERTRLDPRYARVFLECA